MYGHRMSSRSIILGLLAVGLCLPSRSDVITLRENASVTGAILAEKSDQVVVDLGYTVLSIPRAQIVKITRGSNSSAREKSSSTKSASAVESRDNLFATAITPPPEKSVRDLVNQLGESVVQVRTPGGLGSGFFVTDDGYLITNFHVIEGETQISLEVYHKQGGQLERSNYKQVRIVAMNKFADLALLKVEDKAAGKFPRVLLGDSDALAVGERVFAIGSPLGLERTVTEGIISTKTREVQGELYLQTTAQINPGNSGGPLFNLRGEVVGVTNMKLLFTEGIAFAIPVELVKYFLRHRDAFAYDTDNPSNPYRYLEPPSRLQKRARKD
ncbi:MAG TPA: trypsin-like peptidase domain-containing protein [Verrucomicrobiae bacterium]|nr:trypsin-like peptidase domain-containing protein [Verrucomicrobiae bacterium]